MANVAPLLNFIGHYESLGDYNTVWGGIARGDHPPRPITEMTVQEVLNWQDDIDPHYRSEAAGKYQILEDTLRGLKIRRGALFNKKTQDALAIQLLRRRGLDDYLRGTISTAKFANALAYEWASLPLVSGPNAGRSAYAGDGLNKAHARVDEFVAVVEDLRRPMPWWLRILEMIREALVSK